MTLLQKQNKFVIFTDSSDQIIWNDTGRMMDLLSTHKFVYTVHDIDDDETVGENDYAMPALCIYPADDSSKMIYNEQLAQVIYDIESGKLHDVGRFYKPLYAFEKGVNPNGALLRKEK